MADQNLTPSSILARSQAGTAGAFKRIKKLNRRKQLFGALKTYDAVRRQQAIERATNFFNSATRETDQNLALLDTANNFMTSHKERFNLQDPFDPTWVPSYWQEQAKRFIMTGPYGEEDATPERIDMISQQMQNVPDDGEPDIFADYRNEFDLYKERLDIFTSPEFVEGNINVSDATRQLTKQALRESDEQEARRISRGMVKESGALHDLFGLFRERPTYEDVYFTANQVFRVPEQYSESTKEFIQSLIDSKETRDRVNYLSGRVPSQYITQQAGIIPIFEDPSDILFVTPILGELPADSALERTFGPTANATTWQDRVGAPGLIIRSNRSETAGERTTISDGTQLYIRTPNGSLQESNVTVNNIEEILADLPGEQQAAYASSLTYLKTGKTAIKRAREVLEGQLDVIPEVQADIDMLLEIENSPAKLFQFVLSIMDFRDFYGLDKDTVTGLSIIEEGDITSISQERSPGPAYRATIAGINSRLTQANIRAGLNSMVDNLYYDVREGNDLLITRRGGEEVLNALDNTINQVAGTETVTETGTGTETETGGIIVAGGGDEESFAQALARQQEEQLRIGSNVRRVNSEYYLTYDEKNMLENNPESWRNIEENKIGQGVRQFTSRLSNNARILISETDPTKVADLIDSLVDTIVDQNENILWRGEQDIMVVDGSRRYTGPMDPFQDIIPRQDGLRDIETALSPRRRDRFKDSILSNLREQVKNDIDVLEGNSEKNLYNVTALYFANLPISNRSQELEFLNKLYQALPLPRYDDSSDLL